MLGMDWALIGTATLETLMMTGFSLLFTVILGLPLGVLLFLSSPGQTMAQPWLYQSLSFVVNVLRSVPFLILLIVMIPLTRALTGSALGVQGAVPPLVASAAPFFARLVENVLRELDPGIGEACRAMGANARQTVLLALLPEAATGILAAVIVTAITLIGYSATDVMIVTVLLLVVLVQVLQGLGDRLVAKLSRR